MNQEPRDPGQELVIKCLGGVCGRVIVRIAELGRVGHDEATTT